MRFENNTIISGDGIINEQLKDDSHIYVILKGKYLFFSNINQVNYDIEHFEAATVDSKGKKEVDPKGTTGGIKRPASTSTIKK